MTDHPIVEFTSEASWALVRILYTLSRTTELKNLSQIEDKFSPYAKETLAKLISFVKVCHS
jgi:hypothetical protein